MPFAFVQVNALMLIVFNLIAPVAIANFSSTISMAMLTTMVVVGAFSAMFLVANEMEDPFGTEANHLDLRLYHAHFVGSLRDMLAFFPEDSWLAAEDGEQTDARAEQASERRSSWHPRFSYVQPDSPQKDESRRRMVSPASSDGDGLGQNARGVSFLVGGSSKPEPSVIAEDAAQDEETDTEEGDRQTLEA